MSVSITRCGAASAAPPRASSQRTRRRRCGRLSSTHDQRCSQIGTVSQERRQELQPFGGRDQDLDIAVAQDVGHLVRLEQRIDRNEYAARRSGAEHRDDGLRPLVHVHRNARGTVEAEVQHRRRAPAYALRQLAIGEAQVLVEQRIGLASALGSVEGKLVDEMGHSHHALVEDASRTSGFSPPRSGQRRKASLAFSTPARTSPDGVRRLKATRPCRPRLSSIQSLL